MAKVILIGSLAESLINFRGSLLRELCKKGHEVLACAPLAGPIIKDELKNMGVTYYHIPFNRRGLNPANDINTFFMLLSFFRKVRPDIILSYTIKPVLYGSIAGRMAGVPRIFSIITGRGYTFSSGDFKQKLAGMIARFLYHVCLRVNHKVFLQNPDDLVLFLDNGLLLNPDQAVLINGSGIDLDFFKPVPLPEKTSFLLIARLINDKGIYEYVEAARIVKKKYPDILFYLVGPSEEGPQSVSKDILDSWCREEIVKYLGRMDDVRPAIGNSSVYVLPSYCEGTPRTVLEAMSMGRPVITTDAPGCKETVREGVNGFLVPVRDPVALANAILKFIEHPELILTMGHQSRKIVVEKYDVHKVNAIILKTIGL